MLHRASGAATRVRSTYTLLVCAALLAAPPARGESPAGLLTPEHIEAARRLVPGLGALRPLGTENSTTFATWTDGRTVLKVVRPMWTGRAFSSALDQQQCALEHVAVCRALRAPSAFTRRFGLIVPRTRLAAPDLVLQDLCIGEAYFGPGGLAGRADPRAARRADDEVRAAHALAGALISLSISFFDSYPGNYCFTGEGAISGWWDPVHRGIAHHLFAHDEGLRELDRRCPDGPDPLFEALRNAPVASAAR